MAMTPEADSRANEPALRYWPSNQVSRLNNVSCAYCGVTLSEAPADKEHVIGRGFIPKGKLAGCWNLIVRACRACNAYKADLEDDISAITMQTDRLGPFGHDDATGTSEAVRKAGKSFSRRTGKLVKNSHEQFTIRGRLAGGATYTVGLQVRLRSIEIECISSPGCMLRHSSISSPIAKGVDDGVEARLFAHFRARGAVFG